MTDEPKRLPKPSGWQWSHGKEWYVKSSQYGQRYMCPYCGRKTLGIGGGHMHWTRCHRHPDNVKAAVEGGAVEPSPPPA